MAIKKHYDVVAAVIESDGKLLCMKRTRSHQPYISEHWEFPGGKVRHGESDHEALLREIKEEMDWEVYVGKLIGTIDYDYPDYSVTLRAYRCKGGEGQFKLYEHLDYQWLAPQDLSELRWAEADRELLPLLTTA